MSRPLPLPDYMRDRVVSAEVTIAMRTANGRTVTYEFQNITFAPDDVLHEGHGVVMEHETRTEETIRDRYSVAVKPSPEPPVLTLTVKGELRAGRDGVTHLVRAKEPEGDA